MHGVCAGVPPLADGEAAACSTDARCADAVDVSDGEGLQSAARAAAAGACIRLAPGDYGDVELPGGVSVVGGAADRVAVRSLTLGAGSGALACGVTVGAGGVKVDGAVDARIEAVRVRGSDGVGVHIARGSSVSLVATEVVGSGSHGVVAVELEASDAIRLERTVIEGSTEAGIWMRCLAGCDCAAEPAGDVRIQIGASIVQENRIAGVALEGVAASLDGVRVAGTMPSTTFRYGEFGGGISISSCARAAATRVDVERNASFGVLVDGAKARLGGPGEGEGVNVRENVMGVWIQNVSGAGFLDPANVMVENATIADNRGVGVGVSGTSSGIVICRSRITGTRMEPLPVGLGGVDDVGDGIHWLDASSVTVTEAALHDNARASILIDGSATGRIAGLTLSGADADKGIIQQNFPAEDGRQPTVEDAPAIVKKAEPEFTVAQPPGFAIDL
ncbi:right-handed parallel beta-helix repeat-containing protein [Sorangium cellulosum]|uniref:right-handed parallel beta-helix repeat-containing protein n=1 Tax=Sorangium cellulosum TaxID=56 RepID=UPI0013318EF9|nr:right-handed parallel beta-helix repeat-containing protein [Sorangium cellulosum]